MPDRACCVECDSPESQAVQNGPTVSRRQFVQTIGATAAASVALSRSLKSDEPKAASATAPEPLVKKLHDSLSEKQREEICFPWDHKDDRGLLRTRVSNNWQIVDVKTLGLGTDFYTRDQKDLIEAIFYSFYNNDWHDRIRKQLQDDAGGYGKQQTIALFGQPGSGKFEFVMTGRHLTIRCDGDSTEHMAFGGPIFYGHAAKGFNEPADHSGNVFWPQALKANALYKMLDGKQRELALIENTPSESAVGFQGTKEKIPGLPGSEMTVDQKEHLRGVLDSLLEPYRLSDRQEAMKCLAAQGGLDQCRLAFYRDADLGNDGVWDNWRLEGPAFVWHFRGNPHVHVWVNVSDDPSVPTNAAG